MIESRNNYVKLYWFLFRFKTDLRFIILYHALEEFNNPLFIDDIRFKMMKENRIIEARE